MKTFCFILILAGLVFNSCATSKKISGENDDLYYLPSDKLSVKDTVKTKIKSNTQSSNTTIQNNPQNQKIRTSSKPLLVQSSDYYEDEDVGNLYIMTVLPINSIGGAFNGQDFLTGGGLIVPLQKFDDGRGFGFAGGSTFPYGCFELSYTRTKHNGTWQIQTWEGIQHLISMDVRLTPFRHFFVKPYALIGGAEAILKVKDGAYTSNKALNVKYMDIGWRFGAGLQLEIWNIIIRADWVYNHLKYTSATPEGTDFMPIKGDLKGFVKSINIGMGFILWRQN